MKSKDLQQLAFSKRENGDGPAKIFRDLNGLVSQRTIKRWCRMISETSSISLPTSSGRLRTVRTKGACVAYSEMIWTFDPIRKPCSRTWLTIKTQNGFSSQTEYGDILERRP